VSIAPRRAQKLIQEGVRAALGGDLAACRLALPEKFALEITYDNPVEAYRASWYPGMTKTGPQTVSFQNSSYFEVLRAIRFVI
jgi:D-amino peptidase